MFSHKKEGCGIDTRRIRQELEQLQTRRHQLLILCHPPHLAVLPRLAQQFGFPLIRLSLSLSEALLEYSQTRRPRMAGLLLEQLVSAYEEPVVGLHQIELLFLPHLQLAPLRLLEQISRHKALIVSWPGSYEAGCLVYGEPWHVEYHRYSETDARILTVSE